MDNTEKLLIDTPDITPSDIINMKVADLKRELKSRGLPFTGNKPELVERLQNSLVKGFDSLESADDVNEDDVLGDVHLLATDDSKVQDISEDEILGSGTCKDDLEGSLGLLAAKDTTSPIPSPPPPLTPVKTKITLFRGSGVITSPGNSEISKKVPVISGPPSVDATKENKETTSKLGKLSNEERLALRAKKFNQPVPTEAKLKIRSERFGSDSKSADDKPGPPLPVKKITPIVVGADIQKLKLRAERFGQTVATDLKKAEDTEKLLKRKQRFGALTSTTVVTTQNDDVDDKKKRRAERFGNS